MSENQVESTPDVWAKSGFDADYGEILAKLVEKC